MTFYHQRMKVFLLWIRTATVIGLLAYLQLANATSEANVTVDARDSEGWTTLMHAANTGDLDTVSGLLADGASPDVSDKLSRTPLHLAVKGPAEITQLLIETGCNLDSRNAGGVTPMMLAAGAGRRDIVELLITAGARLDLKDYQGSSVVDWSGHSGNHELTVMLKQKVTLITEDKQAASGEDFAEDVFVDVKFPKWFKVSFLDLQEDMNDAVADGKQGLLVFLSTARCSYCKAFIQNSLNRPDIRQRVQNSFDVVGLEIFDDSEMTDPSGKGYRVKEYASANKAVYTPTLIFYGPKGHKLLKIVGYYPPDKFSNVLDYVEGQHYLRESLRDYFSRTATVSSKSVQGIIVDNELFSSPPYMLDRRAGPAEQPMLVIFETPGCSSCERFHRRVLADKAIRSLIKEFETIQLNASDSRSKILIPTGDVISPAEWFKRLDLTYSPAIVFFDENGHEAIRLDSETQRFRMEGSLQMVLDKAYGKDAQLQRWRRDKAVEFFNP